MLIGLHIADQEARATISAAMEHSRKSRQQIAAEMSTILGQHVSFRMLNDFSAECKRSARFPAAWVACFCEVVGDDSLARLVMGIRLRKLVEFAERELAAVLDERERESLRDELLGQSGGAGPSRPGSDEREPR